MNNINLTLIAFALIIFTSCKKEKAEEIPTPIIPTGKVEVIFIPKKGASSFEMNTDIVTPAGETIKITKWKFFISDIGLSKADASENDAIPADINKDGVYLIDFGSPNTTINSVKNAYKISFNAMPGLYNDLRFNIGVPREKNHADPTTATYPLDLSQEDMYWSWNSGYIFMLVEGTGSTIGTYNNKFHFGIGTDTRLMSFFFGNMLNTIPKYAVVEGKTTQIIMEVDFDEIMTNRDGSFYSLTSQSAADVHGGSYADLIKANASEAISFVSTK